MQATIYHNPRCSKSRQTLALLEQNDISAEIVLYLNTGLNKSQIQRLYSQLGYSSVRQMMRVKDELYKQLQLAQASEEELIAALVEHPKLLERPIVVANDQAQMGRPPENVLSLFS